MNGNIDECNTDVTSVMIEAASEGIPKTVITAHTNCTMVD